MIKPQSTPEAVIWVAIDIAKDRHEALIEAPGWKSRKKFRVQNTAEEFRAFADFLHGLVSTVRIGFEPTGNYHRALAYFLHSEGFQLELISSLALARTREAMHNPWDKNDPKDAQVILPLRVGLPTPAMVHYNQPPPSSNGAKPFSMPPIASIPNASSTRPPNQQRFQPRPGSTNRSTQMKILDKFHDHWSQTR
jgi:hypothetical protein